MALFGMICAGEVSERLKVLLSKSSRVQALVGSNPTLSASMKKRRTRIIQRGRAVGAVGRPTARQDPAKSERSTNYQHGVRTRSWRGAGAAEQARLESA